MQEQRKDGLEETIIREGSIQERAKTLEEVQDITEVTQERIGHPENKGLRGRCLSVRSRRLRDYLD